MSAQILLLGAENAACLERIAPEVFDNAVIPAELARFIDDPRHIMAVAVDDGTVVGMASAVEYFHPDKPGQLWINELAVSPGWQRCGIGRQLTAALLDAGRERGCACAWVGTAPDNGPAQACFASVPEPGAPETYVLYEWDLKA